MDPLFSDLSEELQDLNNLNADKKKKYQLNQLVTNGYLITSAANSSIKTNIVNPIVGNESGNFKSILVGISLINLTQNTDATAAALGTLSVNNNKVVDSISGTLLNVQENKVQIYFPIMYEVSNNSQISFELLATVANSWRFDVFFRPKNFK